MEGTSWIFFVVSQQRLDQQGNHRGEKGAGNSRLYVCAVIVNNSGISR